MMLCIYGADTYRSKAYVAHLVEKFKKDRDPQGLNVDKIDAETVDTQEALGRIFASPFLAEKRMVVVEKLIEKGDDNLQNALHEKIKNGTLPDSLILLFWESKDEFKKNELFELIKKEKFSQQFEDLAGVKMTAWIQEELTKQGARTERGVAEKITQNVSTTQQAAHLIHQLALFTNGSRPLTVADVEIFVEEKIDDNIFALTDALGAGNKKKCFELLENQWALGANEHYIFSMLVRQFRILTGVFYAQKEQDQKKQKEALESLDLHPFVVKKTTALLPNYTAQKISRIYHALIEMDKSSKTGEDLKVLLTSFIESL